MKKIMRRLMGVSISDKQLAWGLLVFRVALSLELMIVHGLKKVGWGVVVAETIPNPLHLPDVLNQGVAIAANLIFPMFIITGLFTRLAVLPILAVTLTGYFVQHGGESLLSRDVPFMYSLSFALIWFLGPGKYSLDSRMRKSLVPPGNVGCIRLMR